MKTVEHMFISKTVTVKERTAPDVCETHPLDPRTVRAVRARLKPDETMHLLAETFKALGDPARAKILYALSHAELCVCDLAELVGLTESATSHQLRILRGLRLVKHRREGRQVFYSMADDHIRSLFAQGLDHVEERR